MFSKIKLSYAALLVVLSITAHAEVVGITPGEFRVDESGAATYQIPINVPAGIAGVTPQVALSYSSNNMAEGVVGVGWSLSGSSSITRCPQLPIHDGTIKAVAFDKTDKFCLAGQRLLLASGTYGAPDSTYTTEIASFSRITAKGGDVDNGPQYFVVENKAGETHYYGNASDENPKFGNHDDAFVEPIDPNNEDTFPQGEKARLWALKLVVDIKSNYIRYNYNNKDNDDVDAAQGVFYLDNIEYTGNFNQNIEPFAKVDFNYKDYEKGFKGYMSGAQVYNNKVLESVDVFVDNQYHRKYYLDYENSHLIEERLLLKSVQECPFLEADYTKSQCYQPIVFDWQRPDLSEKTLIERCEAEPGEEHICWFSSPDEDYVPFDSHEVKITGTQYRETSQFLDLNGDGFQDLAYVSGGAWRVKLGPDFAGEKTLTSIGYQQRENTLNIDYNGDGVRDLLVANSETSNWFAVSYQPSEQVTRLCEPGGPCEDHTYTSSVTKVDLGILAIGLAGETQVLDVNGDGNEDIVFREGQFLKAYVNNGNGGFEQAKELFSFANTVRRLGLNEKYESQTASMKSASAVDVNGDGRSDLILKKTITEEACYDRRGGNILPHIRERDECENDQGGDWVSETETNYTLYLSADGEPNENGEKSPIFVESSFIGRASMIDNVRAVDLNGDGLTDIMYVYDDNWYYKLSNGLELSNSKKANISTTDSTKGLTQFIDLNGDGRTDVLSAGSTSKWYVFFSLPRSGIDDLISFDSRGSMDFDANAVVRFGDANGDGKLNLLTSTGSDWKVYSNRKGIKEYVIHHITNSHGINTDITYTPMTNSDVYKFNRSDYQANSDTFSPMSGSQLVSKVSTDSNIVNGITKQMSVSYEYGGLLIHKQGRGSLGFQMLRTIDEQTGVKTETQYNQEYSDNNFAKARMPVYTQQSLNEQLLSSASNDSIEVKVTAQGAIFPYIAKTTEESYLIDSNFQSSKLSETVTTNTYDDWGNVENTTIKITDTGTNHFIQTETANKFGNEDEKRLGRLQSTAVTKSRTNEASITRNTSFSYESGLGMLQSSVVSPGDAKTQLTTTYGYDAFGNKTQIEVTGWSTSSGSTVTRTTKSKFGTNGRYLDWIENSLNEKVTYTYNDGKSADAVTGPILDITKTDANNLATTTHYDSFGEATKVVGVNGKESTTSKQSAEGSGNAYFSVTTTTEGAQDKTSIFDAWGRVLEKTVTGFDGTIISQKNDYDAQGRLIKAYEPNSSTLNTTTDYDTLGRVIQVTAPNGSITTSTINNDTLGSVSTTTNSLIQNTYTYTNGFGETVRTEDNSGGTVAFTYNAFSQLLKTTTTIDGKSSIITVEYDDWGRKILSDDPIKGIWSYTYNAFGELSTQHTPRNHTFNFFYDKLGRKIRAYEANEGTSCWNYGSYTSTNVQNHSVGKLTSTAKYHEENEECVNDDGFITLDADILKWFTYNEHGLAETITTTIDGEDYVQSQTYDDYSRPLTTTYPQAPNQPEVKIRNVYNANHYLHQIWDDTNNVKLKTIDAMNARLQVTQHSFDQAGLTTTLDYYDNTGWLNSTTVSDGNSDITRVNATYDEIGNVKSRSSHYQKTLADAITYNESYTYDELNRLENRNITISSGAIYLPASFSDNQIFAYDGWGNIKSKTHTNTSSADLFYKYDESKVHLLLGVYKDQAFTEQTHDFENNYDANGNITFDGTRQFTYASFDKVTHITNGNNTSTLQYGVGRELYTKLDCIEKDGLMVGTKTTYLGAYEKVERTGGSGELTEHKYTIGDIVITQRSNDTDDIFYLHTDHQGSVISTTNAMGAVVSQAIYSPFGERTSVYMSSFLDGVTEPTERGYTGHKEMSAFGIIHMNGRIYDPTLGRFLQADPHIQAPTNSQNYNRYSYVLNNPLSYTDPSGYFFKKLFKGIKKYWRQIASIGMMFIPGMQAFAMKSWINAAMVGFASGGIATGSLRGALVGAFSGAALQQIGASATWGKAGSPENIIANAAVGGVAADLNGGKFGHGFFAAGFTASLKPQINQIGDGAANYAPARITAAAVVGGTASVISGGKFANGAITGAFVQMFNAETRLAKENKMKAEYGIAVNKAIKKVGKLVGNIGVDEDGGLHGAAGGKLIEGVTVLVDDSQKVTVLGGPVGFSETFQGVLTDSAIALSPGVLTFGYDPASHMSTWSATVQFPGAIGPYVKFSGQFNLQQAMSWHPSVRRTIRMDNYICNSAYKQVCGG